MRSKKELELELSKLREFTSPKASLEQYATPAAIAADMLWNMHMIGDTGAVADLGCGGGILGLGAMLLGISKCYFVDIDETALSLARENALLLGVEGEFLLEDASMFSLPVDIVLQNPPFGVQTRHADRAFLETAFNVAKVVYSFHKIESRDFIEQLVKDSSWRVTHMWAYDFSLRATMKYHTEKKHVVKVACWRLEKGL